MDKKQFVKQRVLKKKAGEITITISIGIGMCFIVMLLLFFYTRYNIARYERIRLENTLLFSARGATVPDAAEINHIDPQKAYHTLQVLFEENRKKDGMYQNQKIDTFIVYNVMTDCLGQNTGIKEIIFDANGMIKENYYTISMFPVYTPSGQWVNKTGTYVKISYQVDLVYKGKMTGKRDMFTQLECGE